ncbi:hypothetical protein ACFQ1L_01385 [Phytohabitans flavus]
MPVAAASRFNVNFGVRPDSPWTTTGAASRITCSTSRYRGCSSELSSW